MSEMIERVARAIWADEVGPNLSQDEELWRGSDLAYLNRARAAIAAMREPTDAMQSAGYGEMSWHDDGNQARDIWRAMIDEALKD